MRSADWPWRPPLQRRKPELTPVVGDLLQAVSKCLDDMAIDAPVAFRLMAIMMNGTQPDEERWTRLASQLSDPDKLTTLVS